RSHKSRQSTPRRSPPDNKEPHQRIRCVSRKTLYLLLLSLAFGTHRYWPAHSRILETCRKTPRRPPYIQVTTLSRLQPKRSRGEACHETFCTIKKIYGRFLRNSPKDTTGCRQSRLAA